MGLGLTICYSIVKNHGGYMNAESRAGIGTIVNVYLPAYREGSGYIASAGKRAGDAGGCRVLYMDDENALREIAGEMLGPHGIQRRICPRWFRSGRDVF